jgi:glycosyltransferase involved in cell wall biosynthesis
VKVAFVINDLQLSGGMGVVVSHARELRRRHGMDVSFVFARDQEDPDWRYDALAEVPVMSLHDAREHSFDVALSTWWETTYALFRLRAERYVSFIQSLEDRFYRPDETERIGAAVARDLPFSAFITEARWIRDSLAELRPDVPCHLVRNGIDKSVFAPPAEVEPRIDGPLRVFVEGYASVWFKNVNESLAAVAEMQEPRHLTVVAPDRTGLQAHHADRVLGPVTHAEMAALYAESDVVLKLSSVEGMYGPPLEGFHMGATCVTTEVTGHEEYVVHGVNALVCDWDDRRGTARQLDLLARDRRLLHELRSNALMTAKAWPSWSQSGQFMAGVLRRIREAPPPPATVSTARLLADVRVGIETHRVYHAERHQLGWKAERYDRLLEAPGVSHALALRRRRSGRLVLRIVRPIARRVRRRLLGG